VETAAVNPIALLQELRELRRQLEEMRAAGRRPRLGLTADRERPLLGQPVTITARLADGEAARAVPRAGAELVLATTWGRLRLPEAADAPGATLALRTGTDGTARAILVPPAAEEPTPDQTEALLTSLAGIDAAASTPEAAREGLEALARQYRWEPSRELRGAVDLLFRERRAGLAEAINPAAPLAAWPVVPAAVTVHALGTGDPDGAVEATALVHLQILDWLPAWYAVYLEVSQADTALRDELELARQGREGDADALLDNLYDRVHQYVAGHRGLAGEAVGRKVAENSLRGFAEKRLGDLPAETRARIFQGVDSASRTLVAAGPAVLAGVGLIRRDTRQVAGKVAEIGSVLQGKADVTEVKVLREETLRGLTSKVDNTRFDEAQRGKLDVTVFAGFQNETRGTLQAKADVTEVRNLHEETRRSLAAKVDTTRFDEVIRGKLDTTIFTGFQTETRGTLQTKADAAEVKALREDTQRNLATKVDATTFDTHQRAVNTNFGALQGRVTGFTPIRPNIVFRPGGGT
jgi:hypothetical protein